MHVLKVMTPVAALALLTACGSEDSSSRPVTEQSQVQGQEQEQAQGVLTTTQQQALDAANSVEQALLDAAKEREEELNRRLQRN